MGSEADRPPRRYGWARRVNYWLAFRFYSLGRWFGYMGVELQSQCYRVGRRFMARSM